MSFSEIVRTRREFLGFSLKAVSDDLQIPQKYILAFEEGDWTRLPPRVYARGFLKKYAAYLDLEPDAVLALFDETHPAGVREREAPQIARSIFSGALRGVPDRFLGRQRLIACAGVLILFVAAVYFLYEFRFAIRPPVLILESPARDTTTTDDFVPLAGRVEKDAEFRLNGRKILTDADGVFRDSILLRTGLNTLVFEATNRFGKIQRITRYIVVR